MHYELCIKKNSGALEIKFQSSKFFFGYFLCQSVKLVVCFSFPQISQICTDFLRFSDSQFFRFYLTHFPSSTFNFQFSISQNPSRFIVTVGINNIPPMMISNKINFQTHLNHFW